MPPDEGGTSRLRGEAGNHTSESQKGNAQGDQARLPESNSGGGVKGARNEKRGREGRREDRAVGYHGGIGGKEKKKRKGGRSMTKGADPQVLHPTRLCRRKDNEKNLYSALKEGAVSRKKRKRKPRRASTQKWAAG